MAKYRKKPVVIEAWQWLPGEGTSDDAPDWIRSALTVCPAKPGDISLAPSEPPSVRGCLHVFTLEGVMIASPGDWIIRGVKGELYPCKPAIFDATYERVVT